MQASRAELRDALAKRGACELDGRWQVPAESFTASLLDLLLLTAPGPGVAAGSPAWEGGCAAPGSGMAMTRGEPPRCRLANETSCQCRPEWWRPWRRLVRHCLATFGAPVGEAHSDAWRLDPEKVSPRPWHACGAPAALCAS